MSVPTRLAGPRPERPAAHLAVLALVLPLALPLGGCVEAALGPGAVLGGASLVLTGKTPIDHVATLATGRDCSAVRLEQFQSWCAPRPGPPEPVPFCTRSLGAVDCWTRPPEFSGRQAADPPSAGVHEALAGPVSGAPPLPAPPPAAQAAPSLPPTVPAAVPAAAPVAVPLVMPAVAPAAP